MLDRQYWQGVFMASDFKSRQEISDARLAQAGTELFGRHYLGRHIVVPDIAGEQKLEIVKVNFGNRWTEPTFDCLQGTKTVTNIGFDKIMDVDPIPVDHDWSVVGAPYEDGFITKMLRISSVRGITNVKDLLLLAGRKARSDQDDVIVEHFSGPSPTGVDLLYTDPAMPMFFVKDRWGQWVAYLALTDLQFVEDWEKTA